MSHRDQAEDAQRPRSTEARRAYARGYSAGRRNVPWTFLRDRSAAAIRGWGAGQAWLEQLTGPDFDSVTSVP